MQRLSFGQCRLRQSSQHVSLRGLKHSSEACMILVQHVCLWWVLQCSDAHYCVHKYAVRHECIYPSHALSRHRAEGVACNALLQQYSAHHVWLACHRIPAQRHLLFASQAFSTLEKDAMTAQTAGQQKCTQSPHESYTAALPDRLQTG